MTRTVTLAALCYFALVFAAGFLLGTVRTMLVAPAIGETAAVVVEVPLMLVLAWTACGWTVRRLRLSSAAGTRLAMGALAFALLMLAETMLGILLFGRSFGAQLASYASAPGAIGLAAQLIYAAFPLVHARSSDGRPSTLP